MDNSDYYGIIQGTPIGVDNIFALILYTDFDELSSDFSRSFRKIHAFETFENVKMRNSYYWWWSKILRETVELYGICRSYDFWWRKSLGKQDEYDTGLYGPFFSGVSFVMNIPQFQINLNTPTSTSKHIEVATKFADDRGMIIELDIGSDDVMKKLRGFDCSWISQYKEEDEM